MENIHDCLLTQHADPCLLATYSAFCRKFGHHSTPAEGERNWNEEAMSSMVNDLTGPIDGLIAFTASKETQVVDSFLKTTRTAEDKLSEWCLNTALNGR